MKKAIVLDVDGVIIGEKAGINTPHPHTDVMAKMKSVCASGIPIILCTAKPAFGIEYEITEANLDNPHIADGGGLLVDNKGKIYSKFALDNMLSKAIVEALLKKQVYTEVYTATDYYVQQNQVCDITEKHSFVLQREPQIVDSLADICINNEVTKVMQVVADESHKPYGDDNFAQFKTQATMVWAIHPPILPLQFGIITALNISKPQGLIGVAKILNVPLENMLGVGDSTSDWKFMELCGYAGAMGNATDELKKHVESKGKGNCFIGNSVDENGVIGILDWYLKI